MFTIRALTSRAEEILKGCSMLSHTFYQMWLADTPSVPIPMPVMQYYATQWRCFESQFTRFMSSIHAQCDVPEARQIIVENIADEEGSKDRPAHLSLWEDFCKGIGCSDLVVSPNLHTQALINNYRVLCSQYGWKAGIAAMYAYEAQAAEIAFTKKKALQGKFGINCDKTLAFMTLHAEVDKWHKEQWETMISQHITEEDSELFEQSLTSSARYLLWFLDGIIEYASAHSYQLPPTC